MMRHTSFVRACALAIATLSVTATAARAQSPPVPLQVDVVLARYDGDRLVSSLPFTLLVNADDRSRTSVRMGVQVPIPTRKEGATEISYQNVGTQIDCSAESMPGGFSLTLTINDSSLYEPPQNGQAVAPATVAGYPVIRSFFSMTKIGIKDGETMQYTMATDKISGETLKVHVTLKTLAK